MNNFAAM